MYPSCRAHTHTQHQRFSEMRVRVAHAMINNLKIPLECLWSTWEKLKDALKSVVWKGWKNRAVNRKDWFVAWARHRSLCSQLSRGGGFTGLEASLSSCLGIYYNVFIAFHF